MRKLIQRANNAPDQRSDSATLKRTRKNIYWQAGLALLTIVLTVIIIFSMTAAWYTNIVQTSGLIFEVEPWGFNGEITVAEEPIVASPGDSGVICLEVENTTDDIAVVGVNVSKARMEEEMRKRLFFYVDTQQYRNGEQMERVYLSDQVSYSYTLFASSTLTLTEQRHNDAQLKWEWVYDVLGYYVLAQASEDGSAVSVYEYLRPIEYDYDEATTTFTTQTNDAGEVVSILELETVDGTTTVDEFLVTLSQTDGYAGTIDPDLKNAAGYYPVSVDENGYGVFAYLCSYSEIETHIQYDTALGQTAAGLPETDESEGSTVLEPIRYVAQLTITAQNDNSDPYPVSSLEVLQAALDSGLFDVIQLNSDITIPAGQSLSFSAGDRVMLDLNGHTITSEAEVAVEADAGSSITLYNGTIAGTGAGYGVLTTGAEVTMSDVDVTDVKYGVYLKDNTSDNNAQDSKVRMVGCEVTAATAAVYIVGNGTCSGQNSQLVVENCVLVGEEGYGISGNGTATGTGMWGTDIQVINSKVTGYWAGIYHPQKESVLSIYNCQISGYTGLVIKGGEVYIDGAAVAQDTTEAGAELTISGTVITGTGERQAAAFLASGFSDTGDAIYIETNYGYEILLEIRGDTTLTSDYGYSLQVYESSAANVDINIYSGKFQRLLPYGYLAAGSVQDQTSYEVTMTEE